MIKAIIIDDEPNNVASLQQLIKQFCADVTIIGSADSKNSGVSLIKALQPQLVFLDIEMPFGNGFDLLNELGEVTFELIFVTAFDNYAIKAFKYAAIDYLLKPINIDELQAAVNKVVKQLNVKSVNSKVSQLLQNMDTANPQIKKIALAGLDGVTFIKTEDIMRLEANKNYTEVYIKGQAKIVATKTLGSFEELLPDTIFCRIHHSHIVNLNFVKKYIKGRGGYVEMEDGANLEVSVRKKDSFFEKFLQK